MAMSKEEQKAASDRIMKKLGPLEGVELETYEMLVRKPEDYRYPGEKRVCGRCGAEFTDVGASRDNPARTALEQFSDHQSEHNATPGQWSEAHKRIQAGKEAAKSAS
jgi:hypothetical protein